jgi:hypothetical protein
VTACRRSLDQINKIGFVAAKPIGTVLLNINSVLMGRRPTPTPLSR